MIKTELSDLSTRYCGNDCYKGLYTFVELNKIDECILLDTNVYTSINETLANSKYEFNKEYYMYDYNGVVCCDPDNAKYKRKWQICLILLITVLSVSIITIIITVVIYKTC